MKGIECGEVVMTNRLLPDDDMVQTLRGIIREASESDLKKDMENREKEQKAFEICEQKIKQHGLEMKLVNVEYMFDGNKILFYFTAEG